MTQEDIRWQQGYSNYKKALKKLEEASLKIESDFPMDENGEINKDGFLDDIIKEGVIQRFEYTHELAWKVMKDFLEFTGAVKLYGSKDATKEAFSAELIAEGELWMDMINSRNRTSRTYNEQTADEIFFKIINQYMPQFLLFKERMDLFLRPEK
ncbi:nucleotidyltransferase substrate binding protein [Pelobium manganitolerans]|uniref:nucleotidyltransferase substrate binding protein n=1 Tax=Pelobium manganitolerans TaxID=1842495 RepID=UPI003FA364A4